MLWRSTLPRISDTNRVVGSLRVYKSCGIRRAICTQKNVQSYISDSHSPHLNLSIEHHLLNITPEDSVVLFLYTNTPSIILGRNQNPWLELNLAYALQQQRAGALEIVRRRSGGGTVFHDLGNINWTVISPAASFTRDKHAEMVTRALRSCGVDRARVNERHDIVLDQGEEREIRGCDTSDMHVTPWTPHASEVQETSRPIPRKVSGSAYKLTKRRALHHGTCLLHSENLGKMGGYLSNPWKDHIESKGVSSVSSPVANVGVSHEHFTQAVRREFWDMYRPNGDSHDMTIGEDAISEQGSMTKDKFTKAYEELRSSAWTYGQTPPCTFAVTPEQAKSIVGLPESLHLQIGIQKGSITAFEIAIDGKTTLGSQQGRNTWLEGTNLAESWSWIDRMSKAELIPSTAEQQCLAGFLDEALPAAGRDMRNIDELFQKTPYRVERKLQACS